MVSFEALLKFHRNRFEGKTCTRFLPLEDWVDVLQVADVMGDGRYLGFVAEYLEVDRRCVDSSHTRQELKKVFSCGCGVCKDDVEGDKGKRALCCGRYYHKACIERKSVCHNCTETWRPQSCWICLRKIDFDELNPLRSYAESKRIERFAVLLTFISSVTVNLKVNHVRHVEFHSMIKDIRQSLIQRCSLHLL